MRRQRPSVGSSPPDNSPKEKIAELQADLAAQWSPWKNGYYYLAGQMAIMQKEIEGLKAELAKSESRDKTLGGN